MIEALLAAFLAVSPNIPGHDQERTSADLVGELRHENAARRLYAARELRRQARAALRDADAPPGSIRADESIVALRLFDEKVAPTCAEIVDKDVDIALQCADILGMLETQAALPALRAAAARNTNPRLLRHLHRAVDRIEAAAP